MKLLLFLWLNVVASQLTDTPTGSPKPSPTPTLSRVPSASPTPDPSMLPSDSPSGSVPPSEMTNAPTASPKPSPTPTMSLRPSAAPSDVPSVFPSASPSVSALPSDMPSFSLDPSGSPTLLPSSSPSESSYPSGSPTASPKPSPAPSLTPTVELVPSASNAPSSVPTSSLIPSVSPTEAPSSFTPPPTQSPAPSPAPSSNPTKDFPSTQPTASPKPSPSPTMQASEIPTGLPSMSFVPTGAPSSMPSVMPSISILPSDEPSTNPSYAPSSLPSIYPSPGPSVSPSDLPSGSMAPSDIPSVSPSMRPSDLPSITPSLSQSPSYGPGTLVGNKVDFELPRCPPNRDLLDPAGYFNLDLDGDEIKDAWGGRLFRDQDGTEIQVVCLPGTSDRVDWEYHVMVNGDSVAKSPWLGGRNTLWLYGLDFDLDGTIEFLDDVAISLRGILWKSEDGPLPGEAFLADDGSLVSYPDPNITTFDFDIYREYCDDDLDGKIDSSIYRYNIGDRNAVKTHFERTSFLNSQATSPDIFVPGDPENTPDDFLDFEFGTAGVSSNFPEDIDLISMKTNLLAENAGTVTQSEEEVVYRGTTYVVEFEMTNALLFGFEILNDGIIQVFFQPEKQGKSTVRIPLDLLAALGYGAGYPANYSATGDVTSVSRTLLGDNEIYSVAYNNTALATLTIDYNEVDDIVECSPDGACSDSGVPEVCSVNGTVTFQKCCCFLGNCEFNVGLADSCPGICFSSYMTVQELSKGVIPISEINIGDKILADTQGTYEMVYSWSHFQPSNQAQFLQLTAEAFDKTVTLELSYDHMVFVDNRAIPASQVKLGDSLHLKSGMLANVTTIEHVLRTGQFAPFTMSGTIMVNDVLSSVYVSLSGSESVELVPGVTSPISMHWVAHTFTTLRRWKCASLPSTCTKETHNGDGLADWIEAPLSVSLWVLEKRSAVLQLCIFVPGFIAGFVLWAMDSLPRWIVLLTGVCCYYCRRARSQKEKLD